MQESWTDLFDLDAESIKKIQQASVVKTFQAGDFLCHEGGDSDSLFFIKAGAIDVLKQGEQGDSYLIQTLLAGELLGEFSILENKPRSASLRAQTRSEVECISIAKLKQDPLLFNKLQLQLYSLFAKRLNNANSSIIENMQKTITAKQQLINIGKFSIICIILLCFYSFTLRIVTSLFPNILTTFVTVPIILSYALLFILYIRQCNYPIAHFGLTSENWKSSVKTSVLYTIPVLLLILIGQMFLLHKQGISVWHVFDGLAELSTKTGLIILLVYIILCPVQEFLARGVCQTAFYDFFVGSESGRNWKANIMANTVFTVAHLHYPLHFAVLVFLPGVFWGWLYAKNRNLAGVSVSHILIGVFGQFILTI